MRTCKEWLRLPSFRGGKVPIVSSQTLREIVKREIHTATNHVVLNRRCSVMGANLRIMFSEGMLSGPDYSRLKIFLRGEYEDRWEALREKEGGSNG